LPEAEGRGAKKAVESVMKIMLFTKMEILSRRSAGQSVTMDLETSLLQEQLCFVQRFSQKFNGNMKGAVA
jgi:hypothetical protein